MADEPRPHDPGGGSDSGRWTTNIRTLMGSSEEPEEEPRYKATLCISSTTVTAAEISSRLGEPTRSLEIGDLRRHSPPRKHAQWNLDSGVNRHLKLHEHLEVLLAFVEARRSEIDSLRDASDIDIFCSVVSNDDINCSFVLTPETSQRFAELALPLYVNAY